MNRGIMRPTLGATIIGCCVGMSLPVGQAAAEISLDADVGAEYSDNVTRVDTDEQTETIGTAGLTIGIEDVRPRLETRVDGDLQYRHYMDDTYDNEIVGGLTAEINWSIIPERFIWVVEDNYGQIAANRSEADTPDNRRDFNYFSTGPELRLPLGSRSFGEVSARWSDVYYEEDNGEDGLGVPSGVEGSENLEGSLALGRQLTDGVTVSLNGSVEEIRYDEEAFDDYRITSAFIRYEGEGLKTQLSIDGGYTKAERGDGSSGGLLARLSLSREITSRTTVTLDVGSEFEDTASAFRLDQVAGGVALQAQDTVASADVFRSTYAYLHFTTMRERTTFDVSFDGRKERHEDEVELDRDVLGAGISLTRRLSPRLDIDFHGRYSDEEFVTSDFAFNEWSVGAGLGWRMTNRLSLRLSIDHARGSGDETSATAARARDYDENRAFLGVRYSSRR